MCGERSCEQVHQAPDFPESKGAQLQSGMQEIQQVNLGSFGFPEFMKLSTFKHEAEILIRASIFNIQSVVGRKSARPVVGTKYTLNTEAEADWQCL